MAQKQGNSSTSGGRLDCSIGTAAVAADFALGAGWGDGTLVKTVTALSNAQGGTIAITSVGSNQAQATATVTFTFPDGAYAARPRVCLVQLTDNTSAVTVAQPTAISWTTTTLSWTQAVIPVDTKVYTFTWCVIQ